MKKLIRKFKRFFGQTSLDKQIEKETKELSKAFDEKKTVVEENAEILINTDTTLFKELVKFSEAKREMDLVQKKNEIEVEKQKAILTKKTELLQNSKVIGGDVVKRINEWIESVK